MAGLGLIAAAIFWWLTSPSVSSVATIRSLESGNAEQGAQVFWAGGCASCHSAKGARDDDRLLLGGGQEFATPFGTFVAPNVSPHKSDGIGNWSANDLANAMRNGVSPDGAHYYPAFPYASYARMTNEDIANLHAYMMTLPEVEGMAPDHQIGFPFNIRRGLGLWKLLFLRDDPVHTVEAGNSELERGRYLVEGPGHCGECHTPRNLAGGLDLSQWMAGAVAAEGEGKVPNITPGDAGIGGWSTNDIAYFLETGFTPEFDSVGGTMVSVQLNMAKLTAEDRAAIAAYLKSLEPLPNGY